MITKANENDVKEIISNAVDAVQEATGYTFKPSQGQMGDIIKRILDHGGYYLILKGKSYLKGWILLDISKDYFRRQNIGFIYEVYILPKYRGRGYSKELIKAALEDLYTQGCNEIERNICSTNFYKEIGFVNHQNEPIY
ncbi:GNAT family N-acetyltransferase [Priestia sp. SIMBA_032]|uniref:GNAT family N-acetyltransferase n=1 Tax=Priestia sp. SIMBA_032 TaxID=3085775 RepID=UPI003977E54F